MLCITVVIRAGIPLAGLGYVAIVYGGSLMKAQRLIGCYEGYSGFCLIETSDSEP